MLTATLPKSNEAGVSEAIAAWPVPDKFTTGGEVKLPCKVSVPVRVPRAVGVNVTFTVQLPPTASEEPQLLV